MKFKKSLTKEEGRAFDDVFSKWRLNCMSKENIFIIFFIVKIHRQ